MAFNTVGLTCRWAKRARSSAASKPCMLAISLTNSVTALADRLSAAVFRAAALPRMPACCLFPDKRRPKCWHCRQRSRQDGGGRQGCYNLEEYLNFEDRSLDAIIDGDNIHGWLTGRIEDVESRYAGIVTALLADHPERLEQIRQWIFSCGVKYAVPDDAAAADCYKRLEDCTLNGMPCDGVNIVTDKDESHFSWEQRFDVHSDIWTKCGGDPAQYYTLRNQFMAGILSKTKFNVSTVDNKQYTLLSD